MHILQKYNLKLIETVQNIFFTSRGNILYIEQVYMFEFLKEDL